MFGFSPPVLEDSLVVHYMSKTSVFSCPVTHLQDSPVPWVLDADGQCQGKDQQANLSLEKREPFFQCWAWFPLTDAVLQGKDSEEVNCHSWKPWCWGRLAFWKLSQGNSVLKVSSGDWKAVSSDRKEQDRELFRSNSLPILTFRWTPFCLTKKTHISLHPTASFTVVIMRARCVPGLV